MGDGWKPKKHGLFGETVYITVGDPYVDGARGKGEWLGAAAAAAAAAAELASVGVARAVGDGAGLLRGGLGGFRLVRGWFVGGL
jgi:hypothetical protein